LLQIPRRLTPPISVDDIGERNTANWPKSAHGIPDRQQCIRAHAGWQPECGLRFFLNCKQGVVRASPQDERSRHEQHVLHRKMISWAPGWRLPCRNSVEGECGTIRTAAKLKFRNCNGLNARQRVAIFVRRNWSRQLRIVRALLDP
jgi:hypothetical protein